MTRDHHTRDRLDAGGRPNFSGFGDRVLSALPPRLLTKVQPAFHTDADLRDHSHRLGLLTHFLGSKTNRYDAGGLDRLAEAAVLHDIGKVRLDQQIVLKPGRLTPDEVGHIRSHSTLGHALLTEDGGEAYALSALVARSHHEKFDGSGYPDGLRGEAIPLEARIVGLCDVYDALRSPRAYKPPVSHAETMTILLKGDARTKPEQFDPALLALFQHHGPEIQRLYDHT